MFYIDRRISFTKRDTAFMHVVPALAVLTVFLILSIWNWSDLRHAVTKEQSNTLAKSLDNTSRGLEEELSSYVDVVSAGGGLFDASDYVNSREWNRFVSIFHINQSYPGIRTVGFIKVIKKGELKNYVETLRSTGNIQFHTYPNNNGTSAVVVYTSPHNKLNDSLRGYDMFSNSSLRSDMNRAGESGEPILTPRIPDSRLFGTQPQILVFSPIYTKNSSPKTEAQRKRYIWGYTYADIIGSGFIGKLDEGDQNFAFSVEMLSKNNASTLLYKSPSFSQIDSSAGKLADSRTIKVNNLELKVHGVASKEIVSKRERNRPVAALWFGVILSVLLSVFIYTLLANRTRALKGKESKEIQSAKDELLALASHQLRTPATGVKQYIGLLREGYSGKLTREQKMYLDKAYESNERQLNTINDMLFVARADTDDIKFKFKKIDMVELTKDILDEQKNTATDSGLKLTKRLPRKPVYINADEAYLRMAIENVVNNAIKYTRSGGNITVKLKQTKNLAKLSVDDTGVGVDEKYRHLLFRKFSRVPNDLSSSVTGSGIGLYLAKKVTDAHKGKITFKSVDAEGSSCTIALPLYKKDK
jgi:signal transduction histidine kinase